MTIKRKTITLKISNENEDILEKELKIQNISLNSFTNKVINDWIDFHRHLEKSEMIILPKKILLEIISTHSENQIKMIAHKMAQYYIDFLLLKNNIEGKQLDEILKTIFLRIGFGKIIFGKQEKYFSYKIEHSLGIKGSILLKELIIQIFSDVYGITPEIKYTDNLLMLRLEKNLVLEVSRDVWNKKFLEDFITPFHMAVSYSDKEELSRLIRSFIQKGIHRNMLNVLIIQKKYESHYLSMLEGYDYIKGDNVKEQIEIIYSDDLFKNMIFGESFEPIITVLDIASEISKIKKKSGINIIGTIAHDLLLNHDEEKCINIEEGWKRIIPHYVPTIQLLCPHKIPLEKSSNYKLESLHSEGFQRFEDGLKILKT